MATYIKGDPVTNATEYVLLKRNTTEELASLGLGSQDLFASSSTGYLSGSTAITGFVFGIGVIPSGKQIAGARLAISPYGAAEVENATKIYIYLYTVESLPLASNGRVAFTTVSPTLVASGSEDILVANNTTNYIVDVPFDEPYYNTNGKFLMLGYNLDCGAKRRKASPDITGAAACGANDGNTYDPLYTWYTTSTGVASTWSPGYDDSTANAYTLLTNRTVAGEGYEEVTTATEINFDVSALNLSAGTHMFVVQATAPGTGYEDSEYSNEVTYTV